MIQTLDASYRNIGRILISKGIIILECLPLNHNRYKIIKTNQGNYLILFKRNFFVSFGEIFKHLGESGVGDTINIEDVKFALTKGVRYIIFSYVSGSNYYISVEDFINYSHKRVNDFENKETMSISIKYLKKWS